MSGQVGPEDGTGGLLVLLVKGKLTLGVQGKISSNGMRGGQGNARHPGGCSGGGRIIVLYGSDVSNAKPDSIKATGGEGRLDENGNQTCSAADGAVTLDKIDP